jgi:hypothetical protein
MSTSRFFALPLLLGLATVLLAGCDGFETGAAPDEATGGTTGATVSFSESDFAAVESSETISVGVTLTNPPGDSVTAEILYADSASATTVSDFNLADSPTVGGGRIAGRVGFPASDTSGTTRSIDLNIQDEKPNEEREQGIFLLQQVRNATIGETGQLTVTIGAIPVFTETFEDGRLAPFTPVSLTSNTNWEAGGPDFIDNAPFAEMSGFQGGSGNAANDWLISPPLPFDELQDESLSFLNAKGFSDSERRGLQVKVSTDYSGEGDSTSVADATWTDVSDQVTFAQDSQQDGNFTPFIESGDIDLSDARFQSGNTYIAFHYRSSGTANGETATWQVDNIELTSSTPPEDDQ